RCRGKTGRRKYNGGEIIKLLGEGGQGRVSWARKPEFGLKRRMALTRFRYLSRQQTWVDQLKEEDELAELLTFLATSEEPIDSGALKEFHIPSGDLAEADKVVGRLQAEVDALH